MQKAGKYLLIILIIGPLSMIGVFLYYSEDIGAVQIRYEILILAVLFHILSWFSWGLRIKVMGKILGTELSFRQGFLVVVSSLFLAAITPSQAGGEPMRIALLKKYKMSYGGASAVVLGERVLDIIFLGCLVPFSIFIFKGTIKGNLMLSTFFIVAGTLGIIFIVFLFYLIVKPHDSNRILGIMLNTVLKPFDRWIKRASFVQKVIKEMDDFRGSFKSLLIHGKATLLLAFLLTAAVWLFEFSIPPVILLSLGHEPIWFRSIAAQIVLIIILFIPLTPGGSGVAEVSFLTLYSSAVSTSVIAVFLLIWRLIVFYSNLLVGIVSNVVILKEDVLKAIGKGKKAGK